MMTTKDNSRSDLEKGLQCPVCLGLFNTPKLLACLHSLCKKCIEPHILQSGDKCCVRCPTCWQDTEVFRSDTSELPTNYIIQNAVLKLTLDNGKMQKLLCGSCLNSSSTIVSFCRDCSNFHCQHCDKAHQSLGYFINHHVITIEEFKEKELQLICRPIMCTEHNNNQVEIYCNRCEVLVCHACTFTHHRTHDFEDIKVIFERNKQKMMNESVRTQEIKQSIEEALTNAMDTRAEVDVNAEEVRININHMIDNFIALLEMRREKLLKDLMELKAEKLKSIDSQVDYLQEEIGRAISVLEYSQKMMKITENPPKFLSLEKTVRNQLKEMTEKTYNLELQETSTFYFECQLKLRKILKDVHELGTVNNFPSEVSGPDCEVIGLSDSPVAVNKPFGYHTELTVNAKNGEQIKLTKGGANVKVVLRDEEMRRRVNVFVFTDKGDGSYDCLLDVKPSGSFELDIFVNEEKTRNTPYCIDSWILDPTRCEGRLELFDDNLGARGDGIVWGDVLFSEGSHQWNVKVNQIGEWFGLGVCFETREDDTISVLSIKPKSFMFYYQPKFMSYSCFPFEKQVVHNINEITSGDILSITQDCQQYNITMTNQRTNQSSTISGVDRPVRPIFHLTNSSFSFI